MTKQECSTQLLSRLEGGGACSWVSGHLQGQRRAGTGAGGSFNGVCVETTEELVSFNAAVPPLIHPSVLEKNEENWWVLRREPPSSANRGQAGVSSC